MDTANQILRSHYYAVEKKSILPLHDKIADVPDSGEQHVGQVQLISYAPLKKKTALSSVFSGWLVFQKLQQREDQKFNYFDKNSKLRKQQNSITTDLLFQSDFQSSNLSAAKLGQNQEYLLLLQFDWKTYSYSQWFYFKAISNKKARRVFKILNNYKRKSLFENGMKITYLRQSQGIWRKGGQDIRYYENNFENNGRNCYTLEWSFDFQPQDSVYFAYSQPFTYTDLQKHITQIMNQLSIQKLVTNKSLALTCFGNRIEQLSISNPGIQNDQKQIIYFTARVHPGQTVSSYVMKGTIQFLLGSTPQAKLLRQKYVIKCIPMLNPDGVILGNYRTDATGKDLNRCWNQSNKVHHLTKLKQHLQQNKSKTILFIDFHGHSKKFGAFFFGYQDLSNPYLCREIPFSCSKSYPQCFSFNDSRFRLCKGREGTARIQLARRFKIFNAFTLETSFCGGLNSNNHYSVSALQRIGQSLCKSICRYFGKKQTGLLQIAELYEIKSFQKEQTSDCSQSQIQDEDTESIQSCAMLRNHPHTKKPDKTQMLKSKEQKQFEQSKFCTIHYISRIQSRRLLQINQETLPKIHRISNKRKTSSPDYVTSGLLNYKVTFTPIIAKPRNEIKTSFLLHKKRKFKTKGLSLETIKKEAEGNEKLLKISKLRLLSLNK